MKQKDFALIAIVIFLSAIVSFFVSKLIFVPPSNRQQQVEVVQPISTDFPKPSTAYFNSNSFDPAVPITLGQNNNANPFSNATN